MTGFRRHIPALAALLLLATQALTPAAHAAQAILGIEAYAAPARIYAGQDFEIRLDISLLQLSDLNVMRPSGLPDELMLGAPRSLGTTPVDPADPAKGVVIHAAMPAFCPTPLEVSPESSVLALDLVERSASHFITSTRMVRRSAPVKWKPFEILPLPEEGRPEDFSGAIGHFRLESRISQSTLAVGDIADWTISLHGAGRLNGAALSPPALDPALFRLYPAERPAPDGDTLDAAAQRIVPLSTNAVAIPAATFTYFDPSQGRYATASSRPATLRVHERATAAPGTVKTIDLANPGHAAATNETASLVQLYLAPSERALKTHLVAPDALETLEAPSGIGWRRVRDARSGHSGWLRAGGAAR